MTQCTRIWDCWVLNASSKRRASCSFGGYWGLGAGFGGRCFWGIPCFLRVFSFLYHALSSGGRLIEDKAHGDGDCRGHQYEKAEALAPQIATTFFITQFIEIGK